MSATPSVGWIGLGAMGLPMAGRLVQDGFPVHVYDLSAAQVALAESAGAVACAAAADAARDRDVVVLMVATSAQLDDVLFGSGDVASALSVGGTVIVMATVGPGAIHRLAERLGGNDVGIVDAPVSGGVQRAAEGTLLIMTSGPEAHRSRVAPVLHSLGGTVRSFGDSPGDAQKVKLVNQLLCGVHIAAAAEALALADALGLDLETCWETLKAGAAASFMFEDRGHRMVHPTDEVRSAVSIFVKDLGLVTDTAADLGTDVRVAGAAAELFRTGVEHGYARRDDSSLFDLLKQTRHR